MVKKRIIALLLPFLILMQPTTAFARYTEPHNAPKPLPYNVFTDAPHTHAGLVAWTNALPYPWPTIIHCESLSDDSWRESSTSNARGVFQFLRSSWRLVGGYGDPAAASWREQYMRARLLRALYGIGSWSCARITGILRR